MEALWEDGYRLQVPWKLLREYVVAMIGGFRTTVADYLGKRARYYSSRGREGVLKKPAKKGYLERFGFIEKKSPKLVVLLHERVGRPYHYEQTNMDDFSLSNSVESNERTVGAMTPIGTILTTTTKREREIKSLHENGKSMLTAEEMRILDAARRRG